MYYVYYIVFDWLYDWWLYYLLYKQYKFVISGIKILIFLNCDFYEKTKKYKFWLNRNNRMKFFFYLVFILINHCFYDMWMGAERFR